MTSDDAEAAARAIVDIFATGDIDAVASRVSEDYVDHQGLAGVQVRGAEGFRRVVEAVRRSGLEVTIQDVVARSDAAALRLRWDGVDDRGQRIVRETLDLLRFEHGQLVEHWGAELSRDVGGPQQQV